VTTNINWPELSAVHTIVYDFDGVFTDNKVYLNKEGDEWVCCNRSDGLGFNILKSYQLKHDLQFHQMILSKEKNPVVLARAKKLEIDCHHGISNKKQYLEKYLKDKVPDNDLFSGLVYLGNDLNDLPMIKSAGFSVAPNDAHDIVKNSASVVLKTVGGQGFIRDFIEYLINLHDMSPEEIDELICNS